MPTPTKVEPRCDYRIWLEYSDGSKGVVDLCRFAGRGVFVAWENRTLFESVHISPHESIAWNDELELCADALYLEMTGKPAEEIWDIRLPTNSSA